MVNSQCFLRVLSLAVFIQQAFPKIPKQRPDATDLPDDHYCQPINLCNFREGEQLPLALFKLYQIALERLCHTPGNHLFFGYCISQLSGKMIRPI
jgi:hypothetical protein